MKLIVVSPYKKLDAELPHLLRMFERGLQTYHLSKPEYSTKELSSFISQIPEKYHNRIIIHSHHELAIQFGLKGIHLSGIHKKKKISLWIKRKLWKLMDKKLIFTTSYKSIDNLLYNDKKYDYVLLSPVFDSLSGNFQAGFFEYNLRYALNNTKHTVVARGGVSADNIKEAHELGFKGVALYSSIWKSANPFEEFLKVQNKFIELKLVID
jgi:thiamine-phosphate pyrophosphorylase